jgi:hypothetical protein
MLSSDLSRVPPDISCRPWLERYACLWLNHPRCNVGSLTSSTSARALTSNLIWRPTHQVTTSCRSSARARPFFLTLFLRSFDPFGVDCLAVIGGDRRNADRDGCIGRSLHGGRLGRTARRRATIPIVRPRMQLSAAKRTPLAVDPRLLGSRISSRFDGTYRRLHSFRFDQANDGSSSWRDAAQTATMQKRAAAGSSIRRMLTSANHSR